MYVRRFDAADEAAVKAVVDEAMKQYGRLDVFFANAGIVGTPAHFKDVDKSEFMKVMETNAARYVTLGVPRLSALQGIIYVANMALGTDKTYYVTASSSPPNTPPPP